jgi:hypothetical protein
MSDTPLRHNADLPSGQAAAALLAAGIGSAALGVLALASDASPSINHLLTFYKPTGALSGVTTTAIVIWLGVWYGLSSRWHGKHIELARVNIAALILLGVGVALTFPPFMDLIQGK